MNKKPVKIRNLNMWKKMQELVDGVHQLSKQIPGRHLFGLAPCMRRSAVALIVNMAEAFEQDRAEDKLRFLAATKMALSESRYYLVLAGRQELPNTRELIVQAEKVSMLLELFIKTLKK